MMRRKKKKKHWSALQIHDMLDRPDSYFSFLLRKRINQDLVDLFNTRLAPYGLLFMSVALFTGMHFLKPINCWGKGNWRGSWIQYAQDYCFVEGTFFVDPRESVNSSTSVKLGDDQSLGYYQWLPFIYFFLALLLCLPQHLWDYFYTNSYFRFVLKKLHDTRSQLGTSHEDVRECVYYYDAASTVRRTHITLFNCWERFYTASSVYFFMKILQIINIIIVMMTLTSIIAEPSYSRFGGRVVQDILMAGKKWWTTGYFPRVALCNMPVTEFDMHQVATKHEFLLQCVLTMHLYCEAMYLVTWVFLAGLQIVNVFNLTWWVTRLSKRQRSIMLADHAYHALDLIFPTIPDVNLLGHRKHGTRSPEKQIAFANALAKKNKNYNKAYMIAMAIEGLFEDFVDYVGSDGAMLITIIEQIVNTRSACEFTGNLFMKFCSEYVLTPKFVQMFKTNKELTDEDLHCLLEALREWKKHFYGPKKEHDD